MLQFKPMVDMAVYMPDRNKPFAFATSAKSLRDLIKKSKEVYITPHLGHGVVLKREDLWMHVSKKEAYYMADKLEELHTDYNIPFWLANSGRLYVG